VSSDITQYDPYVSNVDQTGTNMSVLLVNGNSWVQAGWIKWSFYNHGTLIRQSYSEFEPGYNYWMQPARPVGELTAYEILYTAGSPNSYAAYVHGTLGPTWHGNWVPNQYQVLAETHSARDQAPGGYNNHAYFYYSEYRTGSTWHEATQAMGTTIAWFGHSHPTSHENDIWDTSCAS